MIELKYSCMGVRCPVCGKNVIEHINAFQFSSGTTAKCPDCGAPLLTLKKASCRQNVFLSCFACGETHSYSIPRKSFFSGAPFSFGCKENDVDVLFTGTSEDVDNALFQLSKEINSLTDKYYKNLENLYGSCTVSALRIIEEKAKDKKIICLCGSFDMNIKLSEGGIELLCPHCGGCEFIPVACEDDIKALMERRSILIK